MLVSEMLSGLVAVAGSRRGSPWSPAPVLALVRSSGGRVRVGDAAGVDAAVRALCPGALVLAARSFPGPPRAALARRTRAVVLGPPPADVLLVFPPAGGAPALGPGSSLAVRTALLAGLPVWVAGEPRPSGSFWRPLPLAGVHGWLHPPRPRLL